MQLNRFTAWGIIIADVIVVALLLPYFFDVIWLQWLLFLQFLIVVVVLWKSLRAARLDRGENSLKSLTNWQAVRIGINAGLAPIPVLFLISLVMGSAESGIASTSIFLVAGMPICILGAFIGKKLKNTAQAVWGSAIVSSILAFIILIILIFLTLPK